jgi:hypothetical protein
MGAGWKRGIESRMALADPSDSLTYLKSGTYGINHKQNNV